MGKLVTLDINGDLQKGALVTLEIWEDDNLSVSKTRVEASLPSAPLLEENYCHWQSIYQSLAGLFRLEEISGQITQGSRMQVSKDCRQLAQILVNSLNSWLEEPSFRPIRERLLEQLLPTDAVRMMIRVEALSLRRLPWHLWKFFERYRRAEVALCPTEYQGIEVLAPARTKARILAVLGNRQGINITTDQQLLESLAGQAEIVFLVEPQRQELYQALWDSLGWDILFFAGHSRSQVDGQKGEIEINCGDRLSLDELTYGLKRAAENGLKLAIFNSCDGLGLARQLETLNLPQVIVMREPVPDVVAQEFLRYFLRAFCQGQSLYLAVREAREQLQWLEEKYPCATWLPVIYQNPTQVPISWRALVMPSCPYRGLSAFQEADAPFFFGREAFVQRLVEALPHQPLISVIGPSGSGKSSIVFAGLIPRLRQSNSWLIVSFRPGDCPFLRLAEQFVPLLEPQLSETEQQIKINQLATEFRQQDRRLVEIVEGILEEHPQVEKLLLVADQFEELYTLCSDQDERQRFLDRLLAIVNQASRFSLVLTLRADFLEYALAYRPWADALRRFPPELLGSMNRRELEVAVEMPATQLGVEIESGLAERILNDVSEEPGHLPLLEFALTLLWEQSILDLRVPIEKQDGTKPHQPTKKSKIGNPKSKIILTHAAYEAIGGVKQALVSYAERVYRTLEPQEQQQVQQIFLQLVHPGEGTADTRRLATRTEVGQNHWNLVARLADTRLVVSRQDQVTGEETVEVIHETLIQQWQRLRQWLDNDRRFRTWQERLRTLLRQWETNNCDQEVLLRGTPLLEAQDWYTQRQNQLSPTEQNFIQASLTLRSQEQSARKGMQRKVTLAIIGTLMGGVILAGTATWNFHNARMIAQSADASELLTSHQELEALLEALKAGRQLQKSEELQQVIAVKPDTRMRVIAALQQAVYRVREYNRLEGNNQSVISVSFSPDDQLLATTVDDNTIKLWRADGKLLKTITGHKDRVRSVRFSPDGKLLASASYDHTLKLWRTDGSLLQTFRGHRDKVSSVSFSPDGQTLASASADGTVKLWQLDGKLLNTLKGHRLWVKGVSFSRDGQTLASAGADQKIKLWHRDGRLLKTLEGHKGEIYSVNFSPVGQTLISASADGTVKIWQLDGTLLKTLTEHEASVWDASFRPDGQIFASASADGTIKLWQHDGTLLTSLKGHKGEIYTVSFSSDGQTLASASADTTVKLWHPDGGKLPTLEGHRDWVWGVSFSPDGQILASASSDDTVKLWQRDGTLIKTLVGHQGKVLDISFSRDGQILASAGDNGVIKLWQSDGKKLQTLKGHSRKVWKVSFSQDGRTLASASDDGTVKLWSRDGNLLETLVTDGGKVWSVSFSPDGKVLASAHHDHTVKLWRRDGVLLRTLRGHTLWVWDVSFSPDGQILASAGADGTVKIWQRDGTLLKTLKGHTDYVSSVSFSPDGQILASSSADGTVKLWSVNGTLLKTLRRNSVGVSDVSFSPVGQILASAHGDWTVTLWNLNLENLLVRGCDWVKDYLRTNPTLSDKERKLCNDVLGQQEKG
ncbi:MAG: CHAT domain-containing protein [Coleofasciculaceae cyanobacterium]